MFKKIITAASLSAMCLLTACASNVDVSDVDEQSVVIIHETQEVTPEAASIEPVINTDVVQTAEITTVPTAAPEVTYTPEKTAAPKATSTPKATEKPKDEYTVKSMDTVSGYVNAGSVNLRKGPGTDYKIIAEYERGDTLKITGVSGEWYRVKIDSNTGFMLIEFVEKGSVPTPTPKKTASPTPKPTATVKPTEKPSSGKYSDDELYLVAQVVYLEGRGGTSDGFEAIAGVILNRINSSSFPDTVEGVIFQKNQFTVARDEDNLRAQKPSSTIIDAVERVFNDGENPLPSDVVFFRVASSGKSWGSKEYYKTIDNNSFFSW